MTREQAFREAFRRAMFCDSVGPSGFRCGLLWAPRHHAGQQHTWLDNGVRRTWS